MIQTTQRVPVLLAAASLALALPAQSAPPPYIKIPIGAPSPDTARVTDREPKELERLSGTPIASHMTVTGGRGSLAVGLAFGLLGVAANVAKVKAQNEARGKTLGDLAQTDVLAVFSAIRAPVTRTDVGASASGYELLPIVNIDFTDDKTFRVNCVLTATLAGTGKKSWRAIYSIRTADIYDNSQASDMAAAKAAITPCLTEANRLFEVHTAGGMIPGETLHDVALDGKTVPMKLVEAEYPAHVILPWGGLGYIEHVPPTPPYVAPPETEPVPTIVSPEVTSEAPQTHSDVITK